MTSLSKRVSYLGLADFDYLSARLLLLSGLGNTGFPKAAEAFEKIFKLFLMLEAKITRNEDLTPKDLKAYGHNVLALFRKIRDLSPLNFAKEWDSYFQMLQDSYNRRYPEHWKEFQMDVEVINLDKTYAFFRNLSVSNFPSDERERSRQFGTFLYDAYPSKIQERIQKLGGIPPRDILQLKNESFKQFDIDFSKI